MINDRDIKEISNLLKQSINNEDWELVHEAKDYIDEYIATDDDTCEDEGY